MTDEHLHNLLHSVINALDGLTKATREAHSEKTNKLLRELITKVDTMATKIAEFAAAQKAFNDRQDAAITGLQGDVQALNDKITELQNTPGTITPEDQALLDDLQARGEAITTKLEALDALTPPAVPPPGP